MTTGPKQALSFGKKPNVGFSHQECSLAGTWMKKKRLFLKDLRLILTWGPTPSDLDSEVKFFDASGNEVCKLYWNNKHCEDYASLDVDETNVSVF